MADKLVVISGAARGQGRADAVAMASEAARYITGIGVPIDAGRINY